MRKLRLLPILFLCFLLGGCSVTDIMLALYKNAKLSQQLENPQQEDDEYVRAYVNVAVEVAIRDFQMAGYRMQTDSMKYYYQETLEEVYGCDSILTQFILGKINNSQTLALSTEGTYIDINICTDSTGEAVVTTKLNREIDVPKMSSTEVTKAPFPTASPAEEDEIPEHALYLPSLMEDSKQATDQNVLASVETAVIVALAEYQLRPEMFPSETMTYRYKETLEEVNGCDSALTNMILEYLGKPVALSVDGNYIEIEIYSNEEGKPEYKITLEQE